VEAARAAYVTAADGITSSWRDLVRVHGRFATIYASGCVAIRFGVLPFTQKELLSAVLMCERDHVAFVDQEVRRLRALVLPAPGTQKAVAAIVAPAKTPLARLNRYLKNNIADGPIDLRDAATELPVDHDPSNAPGYIGIHDKKIELLFSMSGSKGLQAGDARGRFSRRSWPRWGV
jgi:hypothetical protein